MKIFTLKAGQPLRIGEQLLTVERRLEARAHFKIEHAETGRQQRFDLVDGEERDVDGCGGPVLVHLKSTAPRLKVGIVAAASVRVCVEKSKPQPAER